METKANLNPNGCLAKALPDEPFFTLLARDPCAPDAISHWAELRARAGLEGDRRQDAQQLTEAIETGDTMARWREDNGVRWREEKPTGQVIVWPDRLTEPLRYILGRPNFMCGSLAHAYRRIGEFIDSDGKPLQTRAEDEQAFVIHRFVEVVSKHPGDWEQAINDEVSRVADADDRLRGQANG